MMPPEGRSVAAQSRAAARRRCIGLLVIWMAALVGPSALAQDRDITTLSNRVQQLEQQMRALRAAPGAGAGVGGGSAAARLEVRQSQSEAELRSLTGRVEELAHQLRQLSEKVDALAADIDYRLGEGGARDPAAAASGPPLPAGSFPGPAAPETAEAASERGPRDLGPDGPPPPDAGSLAAAQDAEDPKQAYAQAYDLLRQGRYEQAAGAFSAFLDRYPEDPLADNARYWLGESFYARGDYARATEVFVDGYQKNKTGAKAPDTLLKLGMSLAALNKTPEACATFRELAKSFPDAARAVREKAAQENRRAGCS